MGLALLKEPIPIETDSDGIARLSGSRVTLDAIVAAFNAGATAEEISYQYPTLQLPDIYAVITYYLRQQKDVTPICSRDGRHRTGSGNKTRPALE